MAARPSAIRAGRDVEAQDAEVVLARRRLLKQFKPLNRRIR